MISYVYKITNKVNGKIYIGKTNDLEKRWHTHILIANGGPEKYPQFRVIHAAISKYGSDKFLFEKLSEHPSEEDALEAESQAITKMRLDGMKIYNLTNGGEGVSGLKHSIESRIKMSVAKTGTHQEPHTVETKIKMSNKKRGTKNPKAKLTESKVRDIKIARQNGFSYGQLSVLFGVPNSTIAKICSGQTWEHVQLL